MSKQVLAVLCVVAAVTAGLGRQIDWRSVDDSLANISPWQRIRGLAAQGLYDDYLGRTCWSPVQDSGLVCVGRWSYGPSYKVSVQATAVDTLVLLTRGSGATIARFRSADSVILQPLGEIDCYGIPHRAILRDTIVCVGVQRGGTGLEVFNVGDPTAPARLAHVSLPSVNDIAVADSLVYLACADDTLRVYGIAHPTVPVLLGACQDSSDLAMCYAEGYCYLVHESGVNIVDVRDPRNPQRAGRIAGHAPLSVQVRDSICCLTTENDGFLVYDVSNPAVPVPLGSLSLPAAVDLYLPPSCDTVAYTSYFHVLSIANPASPRLIGQMDSPGWDYGVCAVPTLNHALITDYFDGIVVVHIGDPTAPAIDTVVLAAGLATDISVNESRAYLGSQYTALTILDVSDPTSPSMLGSYDTLDQHPVFCDAVVGADSFAYMAWPRPRVLSIDVSDPMRPVRAGGCENMFNQPSDMVLRDSLLYCAEASRLQVVNVARPREPELVGSCVAGDLTRAGLVVQDTLAYFIGPFDGLQVFSVADPAAPYLLNTVAEIRAAGCAVVDTLLYVGDYDDSLHIWSFADPAHPYQISSVSATRSGYGVAVRERYAYVGSDSRVRVFDVLDARNPVEVGWCATPYEIRRVEAFSGLVYVCCWEAGVCILDTFQAGVTEASSMTCPSGRFHALGTVTSGVAETRFDARQGDVVHACVFDALGRAATVGADWTVTNDGEQIYVIDLTEKPAGVYLVALKVSGESGTVRVVKTDRR